MHFLTNQAGERYDLIRQQNRFSIGLAVFQGALTLIFAGLAWRLFRQADRRRLDLETLTQNLRSTQHLAEEASMVKSLFLANMSHEIRTPLHGMLGMLGLLAETPLSHVQADQLSTATDSARHLLVILNDILDISKLEVGKLRLSPEPVSLPDLVREIDSLSRAQAERKGLKFQTVCASNVPVWVSADPTRLRQIVLNLLSNAIKFTDHGCVTMELGQSASQGIYVRISDTGIGMDAATQSRLFQRFTQGDASATRRFGGTGLGLEISRTLAQCMGGDIRVYSRVGQGSEFVLEVPLQACNPPEPATQSLAPVTAPMKLRILVSEDHAVNRKFLAQVFAHLGHEVQLCENGALAVQALSQGDFDIVLMDLHTPIMDGFEATRAIRAMPGEKSKIKIVALTADAFDESRSRAKQAGMDDFLTKPINPRDLQDALERHCQRQPTPPQESAVKPLNEAEILNDQVIDQTRDAISDRVYSELLNCLFNDDAQSLPKIRQSLALQDRNALREAAHGLKGAAANLGLNGLANAARDLEHHATDAPWAQLAQWYEHLEFCLRQAQQACQHRGLLLDET